MLWELRTAVMREMVDERMMKLMKELIECNEFKKIMFVELLDFYRPRPSGQIIRVLVVFYVVCCIDRVE